MKREFRLADIGEGLEEAEIIAWRVNVGDVVERDAALVEVMTDKSNADLPAPWSGTVVSLEGAVGDIIKVGELIAVIDDAAATTGAFGSAVQPDQQESTFFADAAARPVDRPPVDQAPSRDVHVPVPPVVAAAPASSAPPPRRAKASPTTRREAVRRGLDLSQIVGSGPGGRVLLSDLDAAESGVSVSPQGEPELLANQSSSSAPPPPPRPAQVRPSSPPAVQQSASVSPGVQPLRGVRRLIAKNMTTSWTQVPHIHAWREIDAEPLMALRARLRDSGREQYASLTPLAFFVTAVAHGLREFPLANSSLDLEAETITTHSEVNVGIAVASPQGLVVPVIRNADRLSLTDTALTISDLVGRARSGALGAEAFQGGTATITNFGSLGGENAAPILRPPESVIVGFGSIAERPFVVDSEVVPRATMNVVVAADHRLLDGDVTTAFLNHLCQRLVDPIDLALGL